MIVNQPIFIENLKLDIGTSSDILKGSSLNT